MEKDIIYFLSIIFFAILIGLVVIMFLSEFQRKSFFNSISKHSLLRSITNFDELIETFEVLKKSKNSILVKNLNTGKLSEISLNKIHLYELDK